MSQVTRLTLLTLVALLPFSGFAQYDNHLILKKSFRNKRHFLSGDSIRIMRNHYPLPTIGMIEAIGKDFIVIRGETIPIGEINTLYHKRESGIYAGGGKVLQFAGPAFIAMAAFNGLIRSISPILSVGNLITGGTLFTTGLLLPLFQVRKYPLGKRFTLRIVPADASLQDFIDRN